MTIVFPGLAVAIAAFCVWLTVRTINRRERWAKWSAVGLFAASPLLYVLSFGPACWLLAEDYSREKEDALQIVYRPLLRVLPVSPKWFQGAARRYVNCCLPEFWEFWVFSDRDSLWLFYDERAAAGDFILKPCVIE